LIKKRRSGEVSIIVASSWTEGAATIGESMTIGLGYVRETVDSNMCSGGSDSTNSVVEGIWGWKLNESRCVVVLVVVTFAEGKGNAGL
jgi:hypothetical protein